MLLHKPRLNCDGFWPFRKMMRVLFILIQSEPIGIVYSDSSQLTTPPPRLHLDVGTGLVGDLHDELAAAVGGLADEVVEDVQIHGGTQVVDVGHEDVLLALGDELVQQARVVEAGIDVTVARRVPGLRILACQAQVCGDGQQ